MAISCYILGFWYMRLVFFPQEGWGVSIFALLFVGVVLTYMRLKKIKPSNESWFWLGVLLLIAASFAIWQGVNLSGLRWLILHFAAVYWVLILTGVTQKSVTSDWLLLDVFRGMVTQPVSRLHIQYVCFNSHFKAKAYLRSNVLFVLFGAFIAAIFIIIAWPLLMRADTGGFQDLLRDLNIYPLNLLHIDSDLLTQLILMFPVAAYIFALIIRGVHDTNDLQRQESLSRMPDKLRVIPEVTVFTALIILNIFYAVFFITQAPYYVAAFQGFIPEGWESYAEFARAGFFELIAISFLNLLFVAFSHLFVTDSGKDMILFKPLISVLSVSSIFLTTTAAARLVLYVDRFGLTFMRVLPAVFMMFLTILSVGIIVKQIKHISIMRLAAFAGALIICLLFIVNLDGFIAGYNANRYIGGTLEEFDTRILWNSGIAGVPAAMRVLGKTDDQNVRDNIEQYLESAYWTAHGTMGTIRDNLQHKLTRRFFEENRARYNFPEE